MKSWSWQKWAGRLWPWALTAATAFVKEVLGADITWLPTAVAAASAVLNLVLALFPDKSKETAAKEIAA